MISIMQRYGEVVCCIGSCESIDNIQVFAQADLRLVVMIVGSDAKRVTQFYVEYFSANAQRFGLFSCTALTYPTIQDDYV